MSRRIVISSAPVVLVAALVTGVALLLSGGSGTPSARMPATLSKSGLIYAAKPVRSTVTARMLEQARLAQDDCDLVQVGPAEGTVSGGSVSLRSGNVSSYAPGPPRTWIGTAPRHPEHVVPFRSTGG